MQTPLLRYFRSNAPLQRSIYRGLLAAIAVALSARAQPAGQDLYAAYGALERSGDKRAEVLALTAVFRESPGSIPGADEDVIARTFRHSRELFPGDSARFGLLDAAFEAHYRNDVGEVLGQEWIDFAGMLLLRHESGKAARALAEIDRPHDLVDVRADKRFAAIVDARPAHYDVPAAVRRRVERMRALVARRPRSLRALIALANASRYAGHREAALALIDGALTRLGSFDDRESFVNWLHDARSWVLWGLQRREESTAELQLGMEVEEHGLPNINQRINLAERYVDQGEPALALKTLDPLTGNLSPYGKMAAELVRLAAADMQGDEATMDASLEYMRGHEPDAPHLLREALVLTGHLEDGAKIFIGELDDPQFRMAALHEVQEFDSGHSGGGGTLVPARWHEYWKRVVARSDVKAAIARYGRVQHYSLLPQ